jgi:Uma2 family endonuclease
VWATIGWRNFWRRIGGGSWEWWVKHRSRLETADQSIGSIKPIPDLSIEVVFSSGGMSKLARYYAIGVTEVWFWEDGVLSLYHRRSTGYEAISRSELAGLNDLDLEVLKRHILIGETDTGEAVRSFIAYLN